MAYPHEPLETLHEIRQLMDRSSRFISLSGLSGVFAGVFALAGAGVAVMVLEAGSLLYTDYAPALRRPEVLRLLVADALCVLAASLAVAAWLTFRQARRQGRRVWDATARRLCLNLLLPLVAGGVFCIGLVYHGFIGLVAPGMLVFYGLALLHASKYTLPDIRHLGLCQLVLGLAATFCIGYGLLFWALGFGVLHIVYGVVLYHKYETNP